MIHASVAFQKFTGISSQASVALRCLLSSMCHSSNSSKTFGFEAFQGPSLNKEQGKQLLWSMGLLDISTQVFSIYKV